MKVTAFNAADAWWLDDMDEGLVPERQAETDKPALSLDHVRGVLAMKALFLAIRGQLLCWSCPQPGCTFIWDGHVKQFRLKCTQCGSKLNQGQARKFILHQVALEELQLPEEYQPPNLERSRFSTPAIGLPDMERVPTPDAPAATTAMQLRPMAPVQPSTGLKMVVELQWTPMPQRPRRRTNTTTSPFPTPPRP